MNGTAEIAGVAVAISTLGVIFAILGDNSMQLIFSSALLFVSGVMFKWSCKSQ